MNYLSIIRRIIFTLCLIIKTPLIAETVGISLLKNSKIGKKVAIINDRHTDVHFLKKIDAKTQVYLQQQSDELQRIFEQLKEKNVKTTAIVELPGYSWTNRQWENIGIVLGNTQKNIYENGWKQESIQFEACDRRSDDEIIVSSISMHCDRWKKFDEAYKKEDKETPYVFIGPKIKRYLEGVAERYSYLSTWIDNLHRYEGLSGALRDKLLQILSSDYEDARVAIEEVLNNSDNIDENSRMLDLFCEAKNPQNIATLILNLSLQNCDIPLLASVLVSENTTCVVHVGMQHGALLHERLLECGFISKNSEFCITIEKDGPYGYKTPKRVLRNISDVIMTFFTDSALLDNVQIEWDETIKITEEVFKDKVK